MQANKKIDKPGVIYMIKCLINNKVYIGESINFPRRYQEHIRLLQCGIDNKYLQNDYDKYGITGFIFIILDTAHNEAELLKKETFWINYYGGKDSDNVYNCRDMYGLNTEFALKARNAFKRKTSYGRY